MVVEWIEKKMLFKMGYSFDHKTLTDFDVSCYSIITAKMSELEIEEMKRTDKKEAT